MENGEFLIKTRDFGEIPVSKENIIHFPKGIYAFEDIKSFVLISPLGENKFPMWLQSAQSVEPCFIVYNPFEVFGGYSPLADNEAKSEIGFEDGDELVYLAIAVIPQDYKKTTINLKSPIVVNKTKLRAVQVILEQDYPIRFPVFEKGDG
ncbi:MAG: flagellar assembly factor FliW [Clostridiales bacterium]|jgi:flagellar assembly factor FliW|nr:hypothetical protein [Oscillospiraceae bacterium]MDN5378009.1 flagellar assembly factor FliW [Clostridiales bacterium]